MGRIGKFYDIELDVTKATINDEELKKILMVFSKDFGRRVWRICSTRL